ncbi:MAG TPA: tetratricopeptide repeat protein [Kofleriaceae bacterium]|nr:tetratricopeptide repeat protein [Kofleriaceae bacterium]
MLALSAGPALAQPGRTNPVPVDEPARAPGLTAPTTPAPPASFVGPDLQLSEDERRELADVEKDWKQYSDAAEEHHRRMRDLLLRQFDDKTAELEARYAARISDAEATKAERHRSTQELLEKFIADHPDHPQFTPDAMFRLADLYLDAADELVDTTDITSEVTADYSKSIALWQQILEKFPDYRQMPSVLYLLGHYNKNVDERKSLVLFLSLACANKYKWTDPPPPVPTKEEALARSDSKERRDPYADCVPWEGADPELVHHAWVRGIADYHFGIPGELDEAIAGYLKVVDGAKDSPLYAEALYKLAWSYYKRDFLLDAIKRFDESVKLYDETVARGAIPPLELREESLQYIAVAFTDPWEGEVDVDPVAAFNRAKEFYKGRENEPHVRDVWEAMGQAFMELQAYDQAVDSFRTAIGPPWELNPRNPLVHQMIVDAYEAKGDKYAVDQTAAELAIRYAPGTPWYTANEKDREAMENQRRIGERALYAAARNTHLAATNLRKEYEAGGKTEQTLKDEYLSMYEKAVELYKTFIKQYPESDYAYEFTYYQGEALFYSERYLEAAEEYRWVRDHRELQQTYFVDAAKSLLASYEAEVAKQVAAGTLAPLRVPTVDELKAMPQPLRPQPIPELYLKLQQEWDDYQNLVPDPQTAPQQGINAALVSLAYLHIDEAIDRLQKVMTKFCANPESVKAKDALVALYEATGQLDKFTEVNQKFIATKCGDEASRELAQSENRSVEFKKAEQLYGQGKFIDAAEAFYRYYKTAPQDDKDLPTALYNAASSYAQGDRPKTAIALYREFTESKVPAFRQSPYYLEAMRLTARSQQSVFDYDAAIATNMELYAVAKDAKARGITPPPPVGDEPARTTDQIALDALYDAATLAELDRDFKQAVELYNRYEREETDPAKKEEALWAIVRIYTSSVDPTDLVAAADRWRKAYGDDPANADKYVESFYDTAKVWKLKGNSKAASAAGLQTIDAWRARGAIKNSKGAHLAGEWHLSFVESEFNQNFEPFQIKTAAKTVAAAKAQKADLEKRTVDMQDKYKVLEDYGVAEYTMAATVRYGDTMADFATKLSQAPTPQFIVDLQNKNPDSDAVAAYEDALAKNLQPYSDAAKQAWTQVVDSAKQAGVSNEWSQLARERLNRDYPDEYPVLHQELFTGTVAP